MSTTLNVRQSHSLVGRILYIPRMSVEGASALAAAFRSVGVEGQLLPEPDSSSLEAARQLTTGEECYPEIVTLGGFIRVLRDKNFQPEKTAFFMPTAGGPCRFGQYKPLLEKILEDKGLSDVMVFAPTSADGYSGVGQGSQNFIRLAWWSIVTSDALRKLLLQTRPYEITPGDTDEVHQNCLNQLCRILERSDLGGKAKFAALEEGMKNIGQAYSRIPARYTREKPLIGIVGEIYCRLDDYSNAEVVRRVEKFGGETWVSSVAEWIFYTNFMQKKDLILQGNRFSKSMLGALARNKIQERDEHKLLFPLAGRFKGYEEAKSIAQLVKPAEKYLPYWGALGEMVLNTGGVIHFYQKGADGVIDISPFTCMNGIVCEAVYPRVSSDHDQIPVRNFYFDGTEVDYDRDVEIFLELARTYQRRKKVKRIYPSHFSN